MTEAENLHHEGSPARHPFAPGASETAVRDALRPEDRSRFDDAARAARESGDGGAVARTLEQWRRVAVVQRDPEQFVRIARRVAEQRTGQPSPPDEPLDVTRAKAGM
ncbi:DUF6247 family protein [Actinomycetospora soli]|uniref:DUF6247 family protein n=1 Tax=Actinomycetospora soli TaxID=2893887 RepID=UPI001E35EDDF|nr:DUF6247 family protein [Actinomycetospora soli]MCD2186632.1 DUF6247 family protein [Actinomycetospora soli]